MKDLVLDKSRLISRTLSYMGQGNREGASAMQAEIESCIDELEREARFRFCYRIYDLEWDGAFYRILGITGVGESCGAQGLGAAGEAGLLLPSKDLTTYFQGCSLVCVVASTLGLELERYLKRAQKLSMSHAVTLDACAGIYLEMLTDAEEEKLSLSSRTYRFCPGYGDLPLELNAPLLEALEGTKKIGVSLTDSGLFLPQKSMLGLIGLGRENLKKTCGSCVKKDDCSLRRAGETCWST